MKKLVLVAAIAATTFGAVSTAQAEVTTSANVGLFSDYKFRGISQTNSGPALQGGFDADFGNGFYLGNWNSNVSFTGATGAGLEMDFYGGYAGETAGGLSYDVGALYYFYEGAAIAPGGPELDTLEIYGVLGYAGFSASLSYAVSDDYFGLTAANGSIDLGGSTYLKLGYDYGISDNLAFAASYGITKYDKELAAIVGANEDTYSDYSIGLTYTVGKYDFGAAIVGTDDNAENLFGKDATEASLIVSVGTSF